MQIPKLISKEIESLIAEHKKTKDLSTVDANQLRLEIRSKLYF